MTRVCGVVVSRRLELDIADSSGLLDCPPDPGAGGVKEGDVLVSYRLRTTGKVRGFAIALPEGADPHLVPTSDVIRCLADEAGVAPEEIELLDLWAER
jgi:hypothetical protein